VSTLAHPSQHTVQWVTAAPLWRTVLAADEPSSADATRMRRPAILRFESDSFMTDLAGILEREPESLADKEATRTSYRLGPPGMPPGWRPSLDYLKLYQPAHGHFNLVAATLTCRLQGLPDKAVEEELGDAVAFVLRRRTTTGELAWVATPNTPSGHAWAPVNATEIAAGEELLPLFPLAFQERTDRRRRLLVGLIPTSSTQSVANGPIASLSPAPASAGGPAQPDPRLAALDERVLRPLAALAANRTKELSETDASARQAMRQGRLEASRFVLLDLAELLSTATPTLWNALLSGSRPGSATSLLALYDALDTTVAQAGTSWTWRAALVRTWNDRARIWGDTADGVLLDLDLATSPLPTSTLRTAAATAFAAAGTPVAAPQPPFPAPKVDPRSSVRYVVRCVYRRPRCGCCAPDVVSEPSEEFAIAPFFDVDAPARPIQVGLPIDTSLAGLRKAPKGVAFVISKELRQQMNRASDMKKLIDGQLAEGGSVDFGTICAFSIPIISICAFILLMVIVSLLNIVFWWLPFFKICFPVATLGEKD
jgi:hypothetical protein